MRVALGRNGAEYFKELYMDALRKTPLYKKLTEEKTADERAEAIREHGRYQEEACAVTKAK